MSETYKIAMISLHSCPLGQLGTRDTGGMNVYVRELARELGALGHRVDIFTRAHDPRDAQVESPSPNVRLIHIKAGRVEDMGKMAQYEHLADFTTNMSEFADRDGARYDVIHSHYWLSGVVGQRLAEAWKAPHVIMFHTLGAVKNRLPVGETEPAVRLTAEKELVQGCNRIITSTVREKADLSMYYGLAAENIGVIPCGVNLNLFRPLDKDAARQELALAQDEKIILFVGRLEALKGLDNLIRALVLLPQKDQLRLLVIGGDDHSQPEVDRLTLLAADLGVEQKIEFVGTVSQARLPAFYNAADVSVVPSYYESFCLVILESLACGTPVVSTPVGVAPSVVRTGVNGYLLEDNSPANLARGIEAVWDAGETCQPRQLTHQSVAGYGWPAIARMIAAEYRLILGIKN